MSAKVPNRVAEGVASVARGRPIDLGSSTLFECVARALVAIDGFGEQSVTALGHEVAVAFERRREALRAKRRVAARARSHVMSGLGLVRTRNGGWE